MIYINGTSGFIGGHLLQAIPDAIPLPRRIPKDLELKEDDIFIQMASPSDTNDFNDTKQMIESMLDDVYWNIDKAQSSYFIFASSLAIYDTDNNYGAFKLAIMRYLKHKNIKYINLIIPRVYGKTRKKGLMSKIRKGIPIKDLDKVIDFTDINTFIPKLKNIIQNISIDTIRKDTTFETEHKKTIREIKDYYNL